jgi:hypothetical protein
MGSPRLASRLRQVSQVVEPDRGQSRPPQQRLKAPAYDVLRLKGCPLRRGKHEAVVLPPYARTNLLF